MKPQSHKFPWPEKRLWSALCHLIWLAGFLVSLLSGLRIWVTHQAGDGVLVSLAQTLAMDGEVFSLHLASALVLSLTVAGYVFSLVRQKQGSALSLRRAVNTRARARTLAFWLLGLLLVTGWLLHAGSETAAFALLRGIHLGAVVLCLTAVLWHALHYLIPLDAHALLSLLRPALSRRSIMRSSLGVLTLALSGLGIAVINMQSSYPLIVTRIAHAPRIDGVVEPDIWQKAPIQSVVTHHGNPFGEASSTLHVQALHDGERIYLLLRWTDATASLAHLPLQKTDVGWRLLHQGFERDDEQIYYEDKLALLISNDSPLAALRSVHLGADVLGQAPAPRHERGYHFTTDGSTLDLWQWKAVRTNSLFQADDHHFAAPHAWRQCDARYYAGYATDPKEEGGYAENWIAWNAHTAQPLRLPASSRFLLDRADAFTPGNAIMRIADSFPLHSGPHTGMQRNEIPTGTLIPSALKQDSFSGDRGDVAAHGRWADGVWTLELSRPLDTGSTFDQPLQQGSYLWLAPFDHAQTRHGYHLRPLQLEFR